MESKFLRWIKRVQATRDEEIDCSACLDQVSAYVDRELSSGDAVERMPQVKQHLDQCAVCHEEYELLRDLARLDSTGAPPSTDELAKRLKDNDS